MTGKRNTPDDAPGSPRPPPPQARRRRVAGNDDENSSPSDHSDMATLGDEDERSLPSSISDEHVGGGDSSEGSEIADTFDNLNISLLNHDPAEGEELAAAAVQEQEYAQPQDDQPAEMDVQLPPPAVQSGPPPEVADQSVAAAAPVPAAADTVRCSGCGSEPASVRLVLVEHACLCLPCRSSQTGRPHCEFCDGPRR